MFHTIEKKVYEYIEKFPSIADKYIYEFNGTVMKIYEVIEAEVEGKTQKVIQYVQDAIITAFENVIGKLVD